MVAPTKRLTGRLLRSLRDWVPERDGPLIEIGTLAEQFPMVPSSVWHGALADTTADGQRAAKRRGIEGRKYQGTRIGVLARDLVPWIADQNPQLFRADVERIVERLVIEAHRKRRAAHAQSARGVREAASEKRAAKPAKSKPKPGGAPKVTSDALFKVW